MGSPLKGYDLVLNGNELGSGSIRNPPSRHSKRAYSRPSADRRAAAPPLSAFFLDALTYGTPPHGGIALESTA